MLPGKLFDIQVAPLLVEENTPLLMATAVSTWAPAEALTQETLPPIELFVVQIAPEFVEVATCPLLSPPTTMTPSAEVDTNEISQMARRRKPERAGIC